MPIHLINHERQSVKPMAILLVFAIVDNARANAADYRLAAMRLSSNCYYVDKVAKHINWLSGSAITKRCITLIEWRLDAGSLQ